MTCAMWESGDGARHNLTTRRLTSCSVAHSGFRHNPLDDLGGRRMLGSLGSRARLIGLAKLGAKGSKARFPFLSRRRGGDGCFDRSHMASAICSAGATTCRIQLPPLFTNPKPFRWAAQRAHIERSHWP
jgi:hypothetical protein